MKIWMIISATCIVLLISGYIFVNKLIAQDNSEKESIFMEEIPTSLTMEINKYMDNLK